MKSPYSVVYTVLITEKGTNLADRQNKYLFKVNPQCNKIEVKRAVEAIFDDVKVSAVNIINVLGKKKRMRSSRLGKRPDWKKAVVTLSKGSIELL
ncbi:MAG: 50S ribosomal protein L23 [Lentisphaeria bacterium]|nr:50S ribosomal protein L23 [Lentisphaeria bacterium]MDY0176455.1 50S ribosomal protein L23 [Lentisphaeria bacterium]NLZ60873.1 50S ribosomal protein L23 [Lentisphaerota bacterium]